MSDRPNGLPLLAPHRDALERCVYCPKLSRATCPVSNADRSETVTPWGKMSLAYFVGRDDIPLHRDYTDTAWACSGCYACREGCEHRNEVATVLVDARAEYLPRGEAPEGAKAAVERWHRRVESLRGGVETLSHATAGAAPAASGSDGDTVLLVGCTYVRELPNEALHAVAVARELLGVRGDDARRDGHPAPLRLVRVCCGLPLLYAGDKKAFEAAAERMMDELRGASRILVVDPGCARTLRVEYPRIGQCLGGPSPGRGRTAHASELELLVELAAENLDRFRAVDAEMRVRWGSTTTDGRASARQLVTTGRGSARQLVTTGRGSARQLVTTGRASARPWGSTDAPPPVRYHDPCQLGRGLGCYAPPRAVLQRLLGAPPLEFADNRETALCSGAGGMLPSARPETSRAIADQRIAEHRGAGGGVLVTACASSLLRFRSRGEPAEDLVTCMAAGLEPRAR